MLYLFEVKMPLKVSGNIHTVILFSFSWYLVSVSQQIALPPSPKLSCNLVIIAVGWGWFPYHKKCATVPVINSTSIPLLSGPHPMGPFQAENSTLVWIESPNPWKYNQDYQLGEQIIFTLCPHSSWCQQYKFSSPRFPSSL